MRIVAISDLHGYLPDIPDCDLLIIAGDLCPVSNHNVVYQSYWLETHFKLWLRRQPCKSAIGVWGNHDWIGDRPYPETGCEFLTDRMTDRFGYDIYGMPWQRRFYDWAFNLTEPELDLKYEAIDNRADIIVSHGPAFGYGDKTDRGELVGNKVLLRRIDEIQPVLVVTGHIHSDPGVWRRGKTTIVNATLLNEQYQPVYAPHVIELEDKHARSEEAFEETLAL